MTCQLGRGVMRMHQDSSGGFCFFFLSPHFFHLYTYPNTDSAYKVDGFSARSSREGEGVLHLQGFDLHTTHDLIGSLSMRSPGPDYYPCHSRSFFGYSALLPFLVLLPLPSTSLLWYFLFIGKRENGYWLRGNSGESGFLVARWLTTLLWLFITQDDIREGNWWNRVRVLDKNGN